MNETMKCGTGCITPSVCHAFFCNRVAEDTVLPSPYPAIPPTLDLDAVREALVAALRKVPPFEMLALGGLLFGDKVFSPAMVADALLAAVARPAEARHDCERWRAEGMGCAECNHTAGAIREYWDDPIRRERDALRAAQRKQTP